MIETFSTSLFLESTLGALLMFLVVVLVFVAGLAAWAWFWIRRERVERGLDKILRPVSFVVGVLGSLMACFVWISSLSHGNIETVWLQDLDGERIVLVELSWRSGKGVSTLNTKVEVFTMDGELLGRRKTSGSSGLAPIGQVGGASVMRSEDALLLVDPVTQKTLADVDAALDESFGAGEYRITLVSPPHVEVERKNGRVERFDMTRLVPSGFVAPSSEPMLVVGTETCWAESTREGAGFYGNPYQGGGLLRARLLQTPRRLETGKSCVLNMPNMGQPVWLALHRSTAFGEEGSHLLSALSPS